MIRLEKRLHPFLFAIYPILFLYTRNLNEFTPDVMVAPLMISVALTLILWMVLVRTSTHIDRTLCLLSLFLIFFFSYGHFYHLLEQTSLLRLEFLGDQKIVLTTFGILFFISAFVLYKTIRKWESAASFLTLVGILLCLIPLFQIAISVLGRPGHANRLDPEQASQPASKSLPDVFYIILDGYPREDVLKQIHHFDNSAFLTSLKNKGFQVLSKSHSNYPGTSLSLSSSLNYQYLREMIPPAQESSGNRWILTDLIQRNRVLSAFRSHGYATAAFDSGYFSTELKHVDHFFSTGWFLNEFHDALIDTTPAWALFKNLGRYEMQRKRILYIFDHLADVKEETRPVFVFGHIMALHPPFVFGPNGEQRIPAGSSLQFWKDFGASSPKELSQQYQDQLTFVNKKTEEAVQKILENRMRPVIIILQGDHGSSFLSLGKDPEQDFYKERFSIFNAIRIPQGTQLSTYDSMSPVNTFRLVLNSLFDEKLQILPDQSYYSARETPYDLVDVTNKIAP